MLEEMMGRRRGGREEKWDKWDDELVMTRNIEWNERRVENFHTDGSWLEPSSLETQKFNIFSNQ